MSRTRCSDEGILLDMCRTHVKSPWSLTYTEDLGGKVDSKTCAAHAEYIFDVMTRFPPTGAITQSALQGALETLAAELEHDWHLGSPAKRAEWASSEAKKRRAMTQHYSQACGKRKPWASKVAAGNGGGGGGAGGGGGGMHQLFKKRAAPPDSAPVEATQQGTTSAKRGRDAD